MVTSTARECKGCGKEFGPLAGTAFGSREMPLPEWIGFSVRPFQSHSAKTAPLDSRSADSAGRHWLSKAFAVAEGTQEGASLSGGAWIGETHFPRWRPEPETRGGKRLRGLSGNQFCALAATGGEACVLGVRGVGKPSAARAVAGCGETIAEGSKAIRDGGKSHDALIEAMGLSGEARGTGEAKGLADSENPMEPANGIRRCLSGFAGSHRGFSRDGLRDWLNLFCFYWNTPGEAFQKAQAFVELAAKKRKILRYRSWGKAKNSDKS